MRTHNLSQLFDLLDTLPNPVTLNQVAFDQNNVKYDKIIYVNKSFLKTIGYTIKDIPDDRTWFMTAYPDAEYRQYITDEWFKAVDQAKAENSDMAGFPANVLCKDGKKRWFHVTTQLSHPISQQFRTIIFMQTDSANEIQQKLDEKSLDLIKEKRLLKTIIDTAPIRIFWKDTDGKYLGCNQAFLSDAGFNDESEIIGKSDYEMVWREDAERFIEDDRGVRESGIPKINFLERQPQNEGNYRMLSTSKVPLVDLSGKTIGVLGLYQDITEEVQTKEALREKDNLLLLQSRQAAMGEMLSMIAHQWRQPLNSISAVVSTMQVQQVLGNGSIEETAKQLETITNQVHYLSHTITDFRNFFKPDKEKQLIRPSELIDHALILIGKLLESSHIQLHLSILYTQPFYTFSNELQHVFINIIKNAADVLSEKNDLNDKWISVQCEENNGFIIFEIRDNGGGIEDHLIDRIFEPYFSTKREKNGTGLGLYMSKIIVEKHLGGTLSCVNREDGALFTVKLPLEF